MTTATCTNLMEEKLIPLSQAAKLFPAYDPDKAPVIATMINWAQRGVKLSHGQLVKLELLRIGGRWFTSAPAVKRFIENQNVKTEEA
jgi:hypothetical protein